MIDEYIKERMLITLNCKDSKYIPKVKGAGKLFLEANTEYQLMHNGIKVSKDSYVDSWVTDLIRALKGHHEPQEEKVFYEVLKDIPANATMLELGSYWSYYSMWFNKEIKNAKNYMIEPVPENIEKGKDNFKLNNMQGDFTNAYIGEKYDPTTSFENWDGTVIPVEKVSVDYFVEKNDIKFLDMLHSDIQGFEYEMLCGAENTFKDKKIGYIFISTHSQEVHNKCLNFLKDKNFKIIAEHDLIESYSVDGLIVAHSPYIKGIKPIKISKRKRTFFEKNFKYVDKIIKDLYFSIKFQ